VSREVPDISVVVPTRDRPESLALCLAALECQSAESLEVIVVADAPGVAASRARADAASLRIVPFAQANISAARNAGIAAARGEVVAFLDDDAVPEPTWLMHLLAPFGAGRVAAAGGYVIGRNGFSFQWTAREVDCCGVARPLALTGPDPVIRTGTHTHMVKTEGTNMAVRRSVLLALGGFDTAFRFYLDETDLNYRLGLAGHATALVPLAQVHHGFAASSRRRADRMPLSLHDIGASTAVFLRKHAPLARVEPAIGAARAEQDARLRRHLSAGTCTPEDLRRLMQSFEDGLEAGRGRLSGALDALPDVDMAFAARPQPASARSVLLAGRNRARAQLEDAARALRADGAVVTVLMLSRGTLFHHAAFGPGGIWRQGGGQFGRSDRDMPLISAHTLRGRAAREAGRLRAIRHPETPEIRIMG